MVPLIFLSIIFFQFDSGVSASACGRSGRSISSTEDKECKFPFTYMNTTYSSCTWRMSDRTHGLPWCSVMGKNEINKEFSGMRNKNGMFAKLKKSKATIRIPETTS